jgi:hypothetical protein
LPYYRYAAKDYWLQAFVNYNSDHLLFRRLPFLQGKMFSESLQGKFLHTKEKPFYTELGYSVDVGMGMGSVGVFAGFEGMGYVGIGVRASVPIFRGAGR